MEIAHKWTHRLWDLWCLVSVIGIWPRWIEPRTLVTSQVQIALDPSLKGLKIALFSDLHLHEQTPDSLLKKIIAKCDEFQPDTVLFAGDHICSSKMQCHERFHAFMNSFSAPLGCYAILGNHDYDQTVGINALGEYDLFSATKPSFVAAGLKRLFGSQMPVGAHSENLKTIDLHQELVENLTKTPFQLLHNQTVRCMYKGTSFNITGVGEYTVGKCEPEIAFKDSDHALPGIVLAHNPDAFPFLKPFPGNLILSGHTHGGQINLPWIWRKLTQMENMKFKKGLFKEHNKHIYVTRGVGSTIPFRWFAPPELVLITLE